MMQEALRAAELRAKAEKLSIRAASASNAEKRELVVHQQALLLLADVDEAIRRPAHVQAKHDYCLEPKAVATTKHRSRNKPGRKPRAQ